MKKENLEKIIALRHQLHQNPELSLQERETQKRIRRFMADNTALEIVDREGWFYAVKKGSDPNAEPIAFRADMDALPMHESLDLPHASVNEGVSHKCGHDGHCAALCGLALELDQAEMTRTVFLFFNRQRKLVPAGKYAPG